MAAPARRTPGAGKHGQAAIPRRFWARLACTCMLLWGSISGAAADPPGKRYEPKAVARICRLIELSAEAHGLPKDFFARLIWKESRFDPNAVSPAGAEGIAQFMPGTAALRGLADPYDIDQAVPASARYLAELRVSFGNLGLAAAAYNAGENRVSRWLARGGFLPLETENYVLDILGEPVDVFVDPGYAGTIAPLHKTASFGAACRDLPAMASATVPMASVATKPWGIQVAGNFRRAAAIRQWQRLAARFPSVLSGVEPVVSRMRSPRGRSGIHAVRIGADSRKAAEEDCARLRAAGGSCIVMRNR